MKKPRLTFDKRFDQGFYQLVNPQKYIGDPNNVIYRSGLEKRYYKYFDLNTAVIEWGSEELSVPYISPLDKKPHRYFPDLFLKVRDKNGNIQRVIVEIKPKSQISKPKAKNTKGNKPSKRYMSEMATWMVNQAKWAFAREFCRKNGAQFEILTEEHIKIKD